MFERFTERARRIVVLAQQQTVDLGHQQIDVGHLVLAALTQDADELSAVEHPVDLEPVRTVIIEHIGPRESTHGPTGHIPFTPALKKALEQGQRIALLDRRNFIDDYDLLLAALQEHAFATALGIAGIDAEALRTAVLDAQRRRTREEGAGPGRGRNSSRPPPFAATPTIGPPAPDASGSWAPDRSAEIVDLLGQVLARLDTIIERLDNRRSWGQLSSR